MLEKRAEFAGEDRCNNIKVVRSHIRIHTIEVRKQCTELKVNKAAVVLLHNNLVRTKLTVRLAN